MTKKILITDDEKGLVEVLKIRFEKEGYKVVTAYDGEECLTKVKAEKPDLIILDVSMPKTDGYTVVRTMKKDENMKHVPVIVLTGKEQMEEIFKVEGIQEYIVKPFEFEALLGVVKKCLRGSGENRGEDNG